MIRKFVRCAGLMSSALLFSTAASSAVLYSQTNAVAGNEIQIYVTGANGEPTLTDHIATGGAGTGGGLGNQGALAQSRDGAWLFAVNAGSNEISTFAATRAGLVLIDKVASGGVRPVSLTERDHIVYVLNAGGDGNIAGFALTGRGHLQPIAGTSLPLSAANAGAAQISFTPDGESLIVTEKATNKISVYAVEHGHARGPIVHPSNGATPFGFAFDRRGNLLVSEAFGGAKDASALSSYDLDDDDADSLSLISGSVPSKQSAACWVALARHGRYAFVTNTGSGTITGYRVARNGELTRLLADGISGVSGGGPTDAAATPDGDLLYVLSPSIGQIVTFRVNADGSVIRVATTPGTIRGATGLVVR